MEKSDDVDCKDATLYAELLFIVVAKMGPLIIGWHDLSLVPQEQCPRQSRSPAKRERTQNFDLLSSLTN